MRFLDNDPFDQQHGADKPKWAREWQNVAVCLCLCVWERAREREKEIFTIQMAWLNQSNNSPVRCQLTLLNWEAPFCGSAGQEGILLSPGSFWEEYKAADD